MTDEDWEVGFANSLAVFLNGDAIDEPDRRGQPIRGDSFLLLFNADDGDLTFTLPPVAGYGAQWVKVLDTADPGLAPEAGAAVKAEESIPVRSRSIQVLRRA